jgi:hypothetical protein
MFPCPNQIPYVGFEVLTAVVMKSTIFCDIMPCSSLKANWHFRGTYRLHPQDRRISRANNKHKKRWQAAACFHAGFLLGLFLDPEDWGDMFRWNVSYFQRTTRYYIPDDSTLQIPHIYNSFLDLVSIIWLTVGILMLDLRCSQWWLWWVPLSELHSVTSLKIALFKNCKTAVELFWALVTNDCFTFVTWSVSSAHRQTL